MFGRLIVSGPAILFASPAVAEVNQAIGLLFLIASAALAVTAVFGRRA